ncbi:MAG: fimbria major subunit [Fermentimonas sp.]|nr:fimbria major subunit [Fermentimonas sp.]
MKILRILLVIAIAFGMMACNNEEVPQVIDGPEATVSVMVVPTSNGPSVRLTGDLSADLVAESAIKTLEVFIFSGGLPDGYGSATAVAPATTVSQVLEIATHAGPKTFYVVANADIGNTITNEATLIALTKDLPVDTNKGLPMTSEGKTVTLVTGENQYGFKTGVTNFKEAAKQHSDTPVSLVRVNARVAIVSAKLSANLPTDQVAIFDALTNIEVAMFNVPKTSKLFVDPLAMNADYLYGEAWPSSDTSYTVGTVNAEFKAPSLSLPIVNTAAPYFYVTENTATNAKEQMLIVLRGKPTKGGSAVVAVGLYTDVNGYTYYPVWVNALGHTYNTGHVADSKILRNTQYNISLTIYGIGNPTIDPVEEAFLDVNVSVEPWTVVTQDVVWGTPVVAP